MKSIIIDTNVIVSALISNGIPSKILLNVVLSESCILNLSNEVYAEYTNVLSRKKFSKIPNFSINAQILLNRLYEISILFEPTIKIDLLKDKSDNKFLELAVHSKTDFLITGNTRDFTINNIGKTKILTPSEFWKNYSDSDFS